MKVIIFADRDGHELAPLTSKTALGLLPIAGKPLLEHVFDSIVHPAINEVWLVVAEFADDIKRHLQTGSRWGVEIHYVLNLEKASPAQVLRRLAHELDDTEHLILRGDVLRTINIKDFLREASFIDESVVTLHIDGKFSQLGLIRGLAQQWELSDILCSQINEISIKYVAVEVDSYFANLDSLKRYHQVNLDVLTYKFPQLVLPCMTSQNNPKLCVGRCSQFPTQNSIGLVAHNCSVHPSVTLENTILNPYVIVDEGVVLKNTIVLSDTYIGKYLQIENAIIWGTASIDISSGTVSYNIKQLRDLSQPYFHEYLEGLFHRSVALFLLVLSAPLWLLALLFSLFANPTRPIRHVSLLDQHSLKECLGQVSAAEFSSWEWATSIPLLRYLPRLLAVITGKLRLVGIAPERETAAQVLPHLHQYPPLGMFSPSYLSDTPSQAHEIDIKYAKTRSFLNDMYHFGHAAIKCFTRQAWVK